jgi:hypothetical protein
MKVVHAPFPSLGFDTVCPINEHTAPALKAAGMSFAIRYLGSVTSGELDIILNAGLLFMPVTFSRSPGWVPTTGMGIVDGKKDVEHLTQAGIPTGVSVWIDLEGVNGPANMVSEWVNDRAGVLSSAGYIPGLYVGSGCVLNADQLYALRVTHYWKSLSMAPEPHCGFCMIQLYKTTTVAGVEVDCDVICHDYKDRLPIMVSA